MFVPVKAALHRKRLMRAAEMSEVTCHLVKSRTIESSDVYNLLVM